MAECSTAPIALFFQPRSSSISCAISGVSPLDVHRVAVDTAIVVRPHPDGGKAALDMSVLSPRYHDVGVVVQAADQSQVTQMVLQAGVLPVS